MTFLFLFSYFEMKRLLLPEQEDAPRTLRARARGVVMARRLFTLVLDFVTLRYCVGLFSRALMKIENHVEGEREILTGKVSTAARKRETSVLLPWLLINDLTL